MEKHTDGIQLSEGLETYIAHLGQTVATFNEWAAHRNLPVRMDAANAIAAVKSGVGLARVAPFWSREDDSGIVHDAQLRTVIECFVELDKDSHRCGHVVGAMQSGKTTTSLALQWAGPALYLLKGERACPFYVIGNQTNHEDQTTTELRRFLAYYGDVELRLVGNGGQTSRQHELDAVFARSPSLITYRDHVLRGALNDVYEVPQLGDLVHRRVGGEQGIRKIAELCQRATGEGYRPLMMIDEPQFGASDHIIAGEEGPERRACVLVQIFNRIEQTLGSSRNDHWFVGLSATPFELNDLERVWEVRQTLTSEYSGFNFFNGEPISPGVDVAQPKTMGLTAFGDWIKVPFFADVSMSAYDKPGSAFSRHARKIGYDGDQAEYQGDVEDTLRDGVYRLLDHYRQDNEWPIGLCIRAFNDNARTAALIARLNLDPGKVEVLPYFGPQAGGASVKRAIARRSRSDLPFVIFVTNRARMADAFPTRVRFFMDLAQKASDLNALLQGLLGRACGYGKKSTVVMSDANAGIVDAYVATNGGYVHKTSRHSVAVGGFRRGAPSGMIKLRSDMADPVVARFFEAINQQVVDAHVPSGSTGLSGVKRGAGRNGARYRTGPVLRIAEAMKLFDHIEQPAVRAMLFRQIPTGFRVARARDVVKHKTQPGVELRYAVDDNGDCRYTFRWSTRDDAAKGGGQGRAKGKKDVGQHMEPTIYVEKVDAVTGEPINDRDADAKSQRPGNWRAFMVTFPLREPVREIEAAEIAYPTDRCAYNDWMAKHEQERRDAQHPPKSAA
jgi:hypothetical protein